MSKDGKLFTCDILNYNLNSSLTLFVVSRFPYRIKNFSKLAVTFLKRIFPTHFRQRTERISGMVAFIFVCIHFMSYRNMRSLQNRINEEIHQKQEACGCRQWLCFVLMKTLGRRGNLSGWTDGGAEERLGYLELHPGEASPLGEKQG